MAGPSVTANVEARLQRLLELRSDTPAMLDALSALGASAAPKRDLAAEDIRRGLRSTVEIRSLAHINAFLANVAPLEAAVATLQSTVSGISEAHARARSRVAQSESQTAVFLSAAGELTAQQSELRTRAEAVNSFLVDHSLSEAEAAELQRGPQLADSGDSFFGALDHLAQVRDKAEALLLSGRHGQLALELLDACGKQAAAAADMLLDGCLKQCGDVDVLMATWDSSAAPHAAAVSALPSPSASREAGRVPPATRVLTRGLRHLRQRRPASFRECQNAALPPLRSSLLRRFLRALSGGGGAPAGSSSRVGDGAWAALERPIDLHAHDPPRYVGDMLAWVHLSLAELREALAGLFGDATAPDAAAAAAAAAAEGGGAGDALVAPLTLPQMLAAASEGVAKPLAARVDGVVAGQSALLPVFRAADLVAFYHATLAAGNVLPAPVAAAAGSGDAGGGGCLLLELLARSRLLARRRYRAALVAASAGIAAAPAAFPSDLGACSTVAACAVAAEEMLRAHAAALAPPGSSHPPPPREGGGSATDDDDEPAATAADTLEALLTPCVAACRTAAEGLRADDTAAFMINNLGALQTALAAAAASAVPPARGSGRERGVSAAEADVAGAVGGWSRRLEAEAHTWQQTLVAQAANDALAASGLLQVLNGMRSGEDGGGTDDSAAQATAMAARPGLAPQQVQAAATAFVALATAADAADAAARNRATAAAGGGSAPCSSSLLFERVSSPVTRAAVRRSAMQVLASAYARVYHEVTQVPANGYAGASLLRHTPEELELMLDLR